MKKKQKSKVEDFPMEKLRDYAPQTKTILEVENKQAQENYEKGRVDGAREKDVWHALLIWAVFIGGLVLGFYYGSLSLLANFCK